MNALLAQWAPPLERSKLGSLVFGGAQFGTIVGNALSGVVLQATEDWRSVFYLFGGLGALWFIIWVSEKLSCYEACSQLIIYENCMKVHIIRII